MEPKTQMPVEESTAPKKILFVDDEEDWRTRVTASLTEGGFAVLAAGDASEAMRLAEEPGLGLIIVDEDLAGESGIMLTSFLRENHPGVPTVLYTTTEPDDAKVLNLMKQGVDQCLPKRSMDELIVSVGWCAN